MQSNKNINDLNYFHSDFYENKLTREIKDFSFTAHKRYNLNSKSLLIPRCEGNLPERHLHFKDLANKNKNLLYKVFIAAYNYIFTNEFAAESTKGLFNQASCQFINWLNKSKVTNRYSLLKDYESYTFNKRNNHGGHSELHKIKTIFTNSLRDEEFESSLSPEDIKYLMELLNTRISPTINTKQISLASYFGGLEWLRDDKLGVGPNMYNCFASPKLTINSLRCMASIIILEMYKAKTALRSFLSSNKFSFNSLDNSETKNKRIIRQYIGRVISNIFIFYFDSKLSSKNLKNAMVLMLLSNVQNRAVAACKEAAEDLEKFKKLFCLKSIELSRTKLNKIYKPIYHGPLFSFEVLKQISQRDKPLPITQVEKLMFSWLMASLTVQPQNIVKLYKNNFRLFKVGNKITHIECQYFKGRANTTHNTRTLSAKNDEGKALLTYLNQHEGHLITAYNKSELPKIASGNNSILGSLTQLLAVPFMDQAVSDAHHKLDRMPMLIPMAIKKLVLHGVHSGNMINSYKVHNNKRLPGVKKSETSCSPVLFGLQAIKNSAVHAYSDPYTLHYLINRNSHTNQTEKTNYLTADNEEWLNAAGRVTRSVMLDLINNVFDLDFTDMKQKEIKRNCASFNNEFASVANAISYRSEEMLSRLKIVTAQGKGVINEVGVISLKAKEVQDFAPIFVLDSAVTVCKMLNYLHEFKLNYKRLLCRNPDYLYQTALPTVEWIEHVLAELSKKSRLEGEKIFEKMHRSGVSMQVFHLI